MNFHERTSIVIRTLRKIRAATDYEIQRMKIVVLAVYLRSIVFYKFMARDGLSTTEITESTERCCLSLCPLRALWFFRS
jgi:hypothetical protein